MKDVIIPPEDLDLRSIMHYLKILELEEWPIYKANFYKDLNVIHLETLPAIIQVETL